MQSMIDSTHHYHGKRPNFAEMHNSKSSTCSDVGIECGELLVLAVQQPMPSVICTCHVSYMNCWLL